MLNVIKVFILFISVSSMAQVIQTSEKVVQSNLYATDSYSPMMEFLKKNEQKADLKIKDLTLFYETLNEVDQTKLIKEIDFMSGADTCRTYGLRYKNRENIILNKTGIAAFSNYMKFYRFALKHNTTVKDLLKNFKANFGEDQLVSFSNEDWQIKAEYYIKKLETFIPSRDKPIKYIPANKKITLKIRTNDVSEKLIINDLNQKLKQVNAQAKAVQDELEQLGGVENLEKQMKALNELADFEKNHKDKSADLIHAQEVFEKYQKDAFIKINLDNKPRKIAFLIDYSGSVRGNPLDTIKHEMEMMLELLPEKSEVSVYKMSKSGSGITIVENFVIKNDNRNTIRNTISNKINYTYDNVDDDRIKFAMDRALINSKAEEIFILSDTNYYEMYLEHLESDDTVKLLDEMFAKKIKGHIAKTHKLKISVFNFGRKSHSTKIDDILVSMGNIPGEIRESYGNYSSEKAEAALNEIKTVLNQYGKLLNQYHELKSKVDIRFTNIDSLIEKLKDIRDRHHSNFIKDYIDRYINELLILRETTINNP